MENLALQLSRHLGEFVDVVPLINRGGKKALPAFLPYAAGRAARLAVAGQIDAVHLADALLAPVGATIKAVSKVPVTSSVCGLDVTYANRVYQAIVPRALRQLDVVMPISRATLAEMRTRTGPAPRAEVIPLGVNPLPAPDAAAIREFERAAGPLASRRVVLAVGRLIERKGVSWFTAAVLPRLPDDVVLVVVGEGPERSAIVRAAEGAGVAGRVRLTGRLSGAAVAAAYSRADVFVMPNVPVAGDIEGFGLVALEAAASGAPVVAAEIDGVTEAVHHKRNGLLVSPGNASAMAATLRTVLDLPENARRSLGLSHAHYTKREYSWRRTAERHAEVIEATIRARDLNIAA